MGVQLVPSGARGISNAFNPLLQALVQRAEQGKQSKDLQLLQKFLSDQQQFESNQQGFQTAQDANQADPGFQNELAQLMNKKTGFAPQGTPAPQVPIMPQFQSQQFKNASQSNLLAQLDPSNKLRQDLLRAQIGKLEAEAGSAGQDTPAVKFAREKFKAEEEQRRATLETSLVDLDSKKQALVENTDPKSVKRLTAVADLSLKKAQLERAKTLSPEEFRHQFALKQGDPGSPEYRQALNTSVDAPVRTEIAKPGNKYKVPPGTIMQFKPDGTLSFPNKSLIQSDKRPGREWYEPLNKSITALDNIGRLKKAMTEKGGGGEDSVGVRDQIWTILQKYTGNLPPKKAVFLMENAQMYSLIKQVSQESRMSDQDLNFLAAILPSKWQSDESFIAVLDGLASQSQASFNRDYEIISDPSMAIPVPSTYDAYYTGGTQGPSDDFGSMSGVELDAFIESQQQGN